MVHIHTLRPKSEIGPGSSLAKGVQRCLSQSLVVVLSSYEMGFIAYNKRALATRARFLLPDENVLIEAY